MKQKFMEMKQWFKSNKNTIAIATGSVVAVVIAYKLTGVMKKPVKIDEFISDGLNTDSFKDTFDITMEVTKD